MDTIRFIEDCNSIPVPKEIPELKGDEIEIIPKYIEVMNMLSEIDQIEQEYYYNIQLFQKHCDIDPSNDVIMDCETQKPIGLIEINTFTTNILSSGSSVEKIVELFYNSAFSKEEAIDRKMKITSQIYDSDFRYRFLLRHRDYSQHRDLPVSINNGECCFDLNQIIHKKEFNINKKIKNEINAIISEMKTKGKLAKLSYYDTMIAFSFGIAQLYIRFLNDIKDYLEKLNSNFFNAVNNNKKLLNKLPTGEELIYFQQDETVQTYVVSSIMLDNYLSMCKYAKQDNKTITSLYKKQEKRKSTLIKEIFMKL